MRRIKLLQVLVWLLLLPAGALFLELVFAPSLLGGGGRVKHYGRFSGYFSAGLHDEENSSSLSVNGNTQPNWSDGSPSNYKYKELNFVFNEWDSEATIQGKLDLERMILTSGNKDISLNLEWFVKRVKDQNVATAYLEFLESARDGNLPGPRHHSYYPEGILSGKLQHGTVGIYFPNRFFLWVATWTILSFFLLRSRYNAEDGESDS